MARDSRTGAITASVVLHALVLAWLGQGALARLATPPIPDAPDVVVELVRPERPPEPLPVPQVAPRTPAPAAVAPPPLAAAPRPQPQPAPLRAAPVPPSPLAPLTAPAAPPAPARGPAMSPGPAAAAPPLVRAPAVGPEANMGGLLREAIGCSHESWMKLSTAERAKCENGFAAAARRGDRFPLPDDKLAAYAAQADANARKRAGREGSLPNTLPPCDPAMVGANMMPSCLPKEAMHTVARF